MKNTEDINDVTERVNLGELLREDEQQSCEIFTKHVGKLSAKDSSRMRGKITQFSTVR